MYKVFIYGGHRDGEDLGEFNTKSEALSFAYGYYNSHKASEIMRRGDLIDEDDDVSIAVMSGYCITDAISVVKKFFKEEKENRQ